MLIMTRGNATRVVRLRRRSTPLTKLTTWHASHVAFAYTCRLMITLSPSSWYRVLAAALVSTNALVVISKRVRYTLPCAPCSLQQPAAVEVPVVALALAVVPVVERWVVAASAVDPDAEQPTQHQTTEKTRPIHKTKRVIKTVTSAPGTSVTTVTGAVSTHNCSALVEETAKPERLNAELIH